MAKSISVLPEQEQQYLTITGKASIALAFFLLAELLSTVISKTDSVIYLLVDLTLFASFIYFLVLVLNR